MFGKVEEDMCLWTHKSVCSGICSLKPSGMGVVNNHISVAWVL